MMSFDEWVKSKAGNQVNKGETEKSTVLSDVNGEAKPRSVKKYSAFSEWVEDNIKPVEAKTAVKTPSAGLPRGSVARDYGVNYKAAEDNSYAVKISRLLDNDTWTDTDRAEAKNILDEIQGNGIQNFMLGITGNTEKYTGAGYIGKLTQEAKKTGDYSKVMSMTDLYNRLSNRYHSGAVAAVTGLMKGTGAASLTSAAVAGINKLAGDNEATQMLERQMDYINKLTEDSGKEHPIISGGAEIAGNLAALYGMGETVGAGTQAIKGFSALPKSVQAVAKNAVTFAGLTAVKDAGSAVSGNMSNGSYARDIGVSALGGAAGTIASGFVSSGLADIFVKYGLQTPFAEFVRQVASGTAFTAGEMAASYPLEEEKPTERDMAVNLGTTFLFSMIQGGMDTIRTTGINKARIQIGIQQMEQDYSEMSSGAGTAEERMAAADRMLMYSKDIRTAVSQNYYAGQQEYIDQVMKALDAMDEIAAGIKTAAEKTVMPGNLLTTNENIAEREDGTILGLSLATVENAEGTIPLKESHTAESGETWAETDNEVSKAEKSAEEITAVLQAQGVEQTQAEKQAEIIKTILDGGEISGNQAASVAESGQAVKVLEEFTGEKINTDAPLSEVKNTIKGLAGRQPETGGAEPGLVPEQAGVSAAGSEDAAKMSPKETLEAAGVLDDDNEAWLTNRVKELAGKFGENGSKSFLATVDKYGDTADQFGGFSVYYEAGKNGTPFEDVKSNGLGVTMSEAVKYAAWASGQNDASAATEARTKAPLIKEQPKNTIKKENTETNSEVTGYIQQLPRRDAELFKKWAANEWVNIDINDAESGAVQAYKSFFERYYEAGRNGIKIFKVGRGDTEPVFPTFLEDIFYKAGAMVAERENIKAAAKPKEEVITNGNEITSDERTAGDASALRNTRGGTLEAVSPAALQAAGGEGDTVSNAGGSGEYSVRPDVQADAEGHDGGYGLGAGERGTVSPDGAVAPSNLPEQIRQEEAEQVTEKPKGSNFIIGESLELPSGDKARFEANYEAIRLVKQLMKEDRYATRDEQTVLSKFVGWGGLAGVFDRYASQKWGKEQARLKEILTPAEYEAASKSTLNAHYTSLEVIRAMYDGLKSIGFTGGSLIEPSAGIGHFAGAMPEYLLPSIKSMTMIELDTVTGNIAKYLYPNYDVRVQGFENAVLPDNYMDAAIGNVPFGNIKVFDKKYPATVKHSIHNYFFAKSLDKVRAGGIIMFITSRYTMDSEDSTVREYIMERADLLGAIRLPDTAFRENARTDVVTDIVILKKRAPGTPYTGENFTGTQTLNVSHYAFKVNTYYFEHPEMVLGMPAVGKMYNASLTYAAKDTDLGEQIKKAFKNIKGKMEYAPVAPIETVTEAVVKADEKSRKNGLVKRGKKIYREINGSLEEVKVNEAAAVKLGKVIDLRDNARSLLNLQLSGAPEADINTQREKLNAIYDAFVKEHGYINSRSNLQAVRMDADDSFIRSLENYDEKTKTGTKADIFIKNTVSPRTTVIHADSIPEGLIVSINEKGKIDIPYIAELTGESKDNVTKKLLDSRLMFKTPDGSYETPSMYLSGNVRAKLREAEGMVPLDPVFKNNAEELKKVIPHDIDSEDIRVGLGAVWVPTAVYSEFAAFMLGGRSDYWNRTSHKFEPSIAIERNSITGKYEVEIIDKDLKKSIENKQKWGTPDRSFEKLLTAILNQTSVTIKRRNSDGSEYVDTQAVLAAQDKMQQIKNAFSEWIWNDKDRSEKLSRLYNETNNNLVTPKYDGSSLTIDGLSSYVKLKPHQLNAIQRIIASGGNTLLQHMAGAGKTAVMCGAIMKMRRLGIIKKPVIIAKKDLVPQWGVEFRKFFPTAKLLVADDGDTSADNRKAFANRIATGDYDAIIMSYDSFKVLPLSADTQSEFLQEQINELSEAIDEAVASGMRDAPTTKQYEKMKEKLRIKMLTLADMKKDADNIEFEQLGVDSIFVDEAHNYKNLLYTTSMNNVSGLGSTGGVQKTFDLYSKIRYLQKLNGGKGIVFATATPVMNSMSEMFIMQKYLQYDLLKQRGLNNFDAWAAQFGEVRKVMEIKPTGQGYRQKDSFSRFINIPELMQMYLSFADVVTDIPELELPKMKTGKYIIVKSPLSPRQSDYMQELVKRAEAVKGQRSVKGGDNMLVITTDGSKMAYSQKMIDPSLPYEDECKVVKCAENVYDIWKSTKEQSSTQLIFVDMTPPKGKSVKELTADPDTELPEEAEDNSSVSLYNDIKKMLVIRGVPENEIAFIHDAKTSEQKNKLFEDMNKGKVRILIGSTKKMGEGMNAQRKIIGIHHLDAPWRPGDMEQRDRRGIRQGNENKEVGIYVYITEGSFDARRWDILKRKSGFINAVMNGETSAREAEDLGEFQLSAAEVMAYASGSPLIKEQIELEMEITKLESLKLSHIKAIREAEVMLNDSRIDYLVYKDKAEKAKQDLKKRTDVSGDNFSVTIGDDTYTERKEAGPKLLEAANTAVKGDIPKEGAKIGTFAGFDIMVNKTGDAWLDGEEKHTFIISGNTQSMEHTVRSMDSVVEGLNKSAEKILAKEKKLQEIIDSKFEHESELSAKQRRLNEVMNELNPPEDSNGSVADEDAEDSDDLDELITYDMESQSVGSGNTSINKDKLPAVFSKMKWTPGAVNLDLGGGKYDNATAYLGSLGVTNYVFDKYNRSSEHNASVAEKTQEGQSDTVTISNVLNVIKEQSGRDEVLLNALDAVKPTGTVLITVYEGDGKGTGRYTQFDRETKKPKSWQENRVLSSYYPEVRKYFNDVAIVNKVMYARDPKKEKLKAQRSDLQRMASSADSVPNWTTTRVGSTDTKPMSLSELMEKIRHDFGIPITVGHIRGTKTAGQYNKKSQGIRTKIANDLPTVAHELGHHLDNKYGLTKRLPADMKAELEDNLSADFKALYGEKKWKTEGLAEYIRRYLQNYETAAVDYPLFTQRFHTTLSKEDLAIFDKLADDVNAYYALDTDTASSSVRLAEDNAPDFRDFGEKLGDKFDRLYQAWNDSIHAVKIFDRATGANTYKLFSNAAYSPDVAYAMLTGGLYDINGNRIGSGLRAALKDISKNNKQEYQDFGEYLIVKHGPERLDEGLRVFADDRKNTETWMLYRQAELEKKYPQFKEASEKLYKFQRDFLRTWGRDTGLVSDESYKKWGERWKYYVPFNRAVGDKYRIGAKRSFANQNSTIKKAHGSGLNIVNPVDNIINNIVRMVNAGYRNYAMSKLTQAAGDIKGTAVFLEKVPMPLKKETFDAKGLKEKLKQSVIDAGLLKSDEDAVFGIIENLDDILIQYGRGKASGDVVTVLRGGRPEYWKINDPMLLESVTNMNPIRLPAWLETYGRISRIMTSNLTGSNVLWSIFSNFPRDLMTMFTYSEDKNLLHILGGIGSAYVNMVKGDKASPWFKQYKALGGGRSSAYTADKDLARDIRRKLSDSKLRWLNPIEWIEFIADGIEMGPRAGYYHILIKKGLTPQEAFHASMDITVNFRRGGMNSRTINKVIPFFNAGVQGLDKFARWVTAEDAPTGKRAKVARGRIISFITVSAALAALMWAINSGGDKKKDYAQLSNYTKNNYFCIPLGGGKYFTIPKPRELAVLTSFFESAMEYYTNGNKNAFDEFYSYFAEQCLPNVISDLAKGEVFGALGSFGVIGVLAYMMANRDFLGKPIISAGLESLEPKDQYTNRSSKIAYWVGQAFNISPQMTDYFFRQTLGGWWKAQQALLPVGSENVDYTLGVQSTYIRDNQYSTDLVNRLYDGRNRAEKIKSSNKDSTEAAVEYKWYDNLTAFYSRYYTLAKNTAETTANRVVRQTVLNIICEFEKNMDNGYKTPEQKAVEAFCEKTGSTEYMPSVMSSSITDDSGVVHPLTAGQYVQYQTEYLTDYWDYAEAALRKSPEKSTAAVAAIYTAAKAQAKSNATARALKRLGLSSEAYAEIRDMADVGIDEPEFILWKAALDVANNDGSLKQSEVIDVLDKMAWLNNSERYWLFHTRYESDKNNPWVDAR